MPTYARGPLPTQYRDYTAEVWDEDLRCPSCKARMYRDDFVELVREMIDIIPRTITPAYEVLALENSEAEEDEDDAGKIAELAAYGLDTLEHYHIVTEPFERTMLEFEKYHNRLETFQPLPFKVQKELIEYLNKFQKGRKFGRHIERLRAIHRGEV